MRLGIISDIHGNLPALEAVLAKLDGARVDRYVCLGDIVGYGPFPTQCVERIRSLAGDVVAGNHDLLAVQKLEFGQVSKLARQTLAWTRQELDQESLSYLSELALRTSPVPGVLATHGSLVGPEDYVWSAAHASRQLGRLVLEHSGVRILLVGHTHTPMACGKRTGLQLQGGRGVVPLGADNPILLNPGAVGQSRQWRPVARALILDLERERAEFCAARYDRSAVLEALRNKGLPVQSHHRRPTALSALTDSIRDGHRALRRLPRGRSSRF